MFKKLLRFFCREEIILAVYFLASVLIGIQHYMGGALKYNNFLVFRNSVFHLLEHKNLYIEYPAEYFDLFLYHPSFSILFFPLSFLPVSVSLVLWLVFCSFLLFYAIKKLPVSSSARTFLWWFVLIELTTSLHNQQTNPIMAACGLLMFAFLEKDKPIWASLFPILAFCIKGYGLVFAIMFLFYPKKIQYIGYSIVWLILLTLLPIPLVGPTYFFQLYSDWFISLTNDHSVNYGYSIMGLLKVWWPAFSEDGVTKVQIAGLVLFLATFILNLVNGSFDVKSRRIELLAYTFLWVIMFNHTAESPTYIIAIVGVALYYIVNRGTMQSKILIYLVLFFSMLSPTDFYPGFLKKEFFQPYLIKVIPCFLVWITLQIILVIKKNNAKIQQ